MSDAITEFAHHAALALAEISDPAALVNAADEALASLEQQCGSLHGPHRYAADAVANALYRLRSGQPRAAECATEEVMNWLRKAMLLAHGGMDACGLLYAGRDLERASAIVDWMPSEHRPLAELLRCVIGEVERSVIEMVIERQHGGGHVRAA
jgi:hypothetical protein